MSAGVIVFVLLGIVALVGVLAAAAIFDDERARKDRVIL